MHFGLIESLQSRSTKAQVVVKGQILPNGTDDIALFFLPKQYTWDFNYLGASLCHLWSFNTVWASLYNKCITMPRWSMNTMSLWQWCQMTYEYEFMTLVRTILTISLWQWWWQYLLGVYDIGDDNNDSMTMINDDANSMSLWQWWWQ